MEGRAAAERGKERREGEGGREAIWWQIAYAERIRYIDR
jgi:hypothetical protein